MQLVRFTTACARQNKHWNGHHTAYKPLPIRPHKLSVSAGSPAMVMAVLALPVVVQSSLAVLHAEVIPAGLLRNQRIHTIGQEPAVMHQLWSLITSIRREERLELPKGDAIQTQPAAISQKHRKVP